MNRLLWVLQIVFGLYFIGVGVVHFVVPDGLPAQMEWMYDLSDTLHTVSGVAEILGGLGLILPAVTRIRPELVAYAAFGLALVMVGAIVWHLGRGESIQIVLNLVNAVILGFIGYGRMRLHPIAARHG
ncbi:MAG: DoxX family protein [Acidimicrobiia bacterium]